MICKWAVVSKKDSGDANHFLAFIVWCDLDKAPAFFGYVLSNGWGKVIAGLQLPSVNS